MTKDELIELAQVGMGIHSPNQPEYIVCEALIKALAQTEQEPVALQRDVIVVNLVREGINKHRARELAEHFSKHTTPPQRTWVGLTEAQCGVLWKTNMTPFEYYQAIEAKLKEKNI